MSDDAVMASDDAGESSARPRVDDMSRAAVLLMQGVVYRSDGGDWGRVLEHQARLRSHFAVVGLDLVVDEAEGWAFLRTHPGDADPGASHDDVKLPRLIPRHQLTFEVSLLLALLRRRLAEFDAKGGDTRLVLSRGEIVELARLFLPGGGDDLRLYREIDRYIARVAELGFLRELPPSSSDAGSFEVRRILKAFVDAQWLGELDERLAAYQQVAEQRRNEGNDD
jgi:hypothetical protein